jgi:hypothetical protein
VWSDFESPYLFVIDFLPGQHPVSGGCQIWRHKTLSLRHLWLFLGLAGN